MEVVEGPPTRTGGLDGPVALVAALLAFFLPGAGHIYCDKIGKGLLILLAGHAEVVRNDEGGERKVGELHPGDVAGENEWHRALYVGMTRASEGLALVCPQMLRGKFRHPTRVLIDAGIAQPNPNAE